MARLQLVPLLHGALEHEDVKHVEVLRPVELDSDEEPDEDQGEAHTPRLQRSPWMPQYTIS